MKNSKKLMIAEYELPVEVSQESDGGFTARCPKWMDCYAQGDSIEEAINEISYVASTLIELYKEENFKIPLTLKKEKEETKNVLNFTFPLVVSRS